MGGDWDDLTDEQLGELDRACDEFESAWGSPRGRSIEETLSSRPSAVRDRLFGELLAVEIESRRARGEAPNLNDYVDRFPLHRDLIESTLAESTPAPNSRSSSISAATRQTWSAKLDDTGPIPALIKPAASTADAAAIPTEVGRYRIKRLLGDGGMGVVYLAVDTRLGRQVAIKLPKIDRQSPRCDEVLARFCRETRAMADLNHPNLCAIHDVGTFNNVPYLAMSYVAGPTLSERVETTGRPSVPEALRWVATLAAAIQVAHDAGVVHRDLKPANVMLNGQGEPIIMDFGLASQATANEADLTQTGVVVGSPAYMAPEQIEPHGRPGPATDIYALGAILHFLLTGRPPFEGTTLWVLGQIAIGARPESPAHLHPDLVRILQRAMARRPAERFKSAGEFAAALRFVEPGGEELIKPHSTHPPVWSLRGRRSGRWIAGALLLTILLVVAGKLVWDSVASSAGSRNQTDSTVWTANASGAAVTPVYSQHARLVEHAFDLRRARIGAVISADGSRVVVGTDAARNFETTPPRAYVLHRDVGGDPVWRLEAGLSGGPAADQGGFGRAVAIRGDRALIGAPTQRGAWPNAGAAYLFERRGGAWRQVAQFLPPDENAAGRFGRTVLLAGNDILVQGNESSGRNVVFVFRRVSDKWQLSQRLAAANPHERFGDQLAAANERLAITGGESVSIFRRTDDAWTLEQQVAVPDATRGVHTPLTLALSDDRLVVGASRLFAGTTRRAGAVYVFAYEQARWKFEQKLASDRPQVNGGFGAAVSLSDRRLYVATLQDGDEKQRGVVYVFECRGDRWETRQRLTSTVPDRFGRGLAAAEDYVFIGAPNRHDTAFEQGVVEVFHETPEETARQQVWRPAARFGTTNHPNSFMGHAIQVVGDDLIVAAARADLPQAPEAGTVHVFGVGDIASEAATDSESAPRVPASKIDSASGGATDVSHLQRLRSPNERPMLGFGSLVAAAGERIVMSGQTVDPTTVSCVFRRVSSGASARWELEQPLSLDSPSRLIVTGLAGTAEWIAVGTRPTESDEVGRIHLYRLVSGTWRFEQSLMPQSAVAGDSFGSAIAFYRDTLLVGACGTRVGGHAAAGAAHVYRLRDRRWQLTQTLTASEPGPGEMLGTAVALCDGWAFVGTPGDSDLGRRSGTVQVFRFRGDGYQLQTKLFPAQPVRNSLFGSSLACSAGKLVIGAPDDPSRAPEGGVAYLFHFSGGNWVEHQELVPEYHGYKQHFGRRVAIDHDIILIGAPGENGYAGAAYSFRPRNQ